MNPDIQALQTAIDAINKRLDEQDRAIHQSDILPQTIKARHLEDGVLDGQTSSGNTLTSPTITTPTITSPTLTLSGMALGDLMYLTAAGVVTRLGIGSTGQHLSVASGLPAWSAAGQTPDEDITGSSSTSSSTYANITGADVAVTLTAASHILLIATIQAYANIDLAPYTITWHDGTTVIGGPARIYLRSSNPRTTVTVHTVVVSAAIGAHTYTVQHKSEDNSTSCTAETFSCVAFPVPA